MDRPQTLRQPGMIVHLTSLAEARHQGTPSRRELVRLAASPRKVCVRVTGGAALAGAMCGQDHIGRFLAEALGGTQADAAVMAGASMSIRRPAPGACDQCDTFRMHCTKHTLLYQDPLPAVMEVLPALAELGAPARTVGIVPTVNKDIRFYGGYCLVSNRPDHDWYTVVDERCPVGLLMYMSTDKPQLTWDDEWQVSLEYMQILRDEAGYRTLHLVCNGGQFTENEIRHVASLEPEPTDDGPNPYYILLVEDAGRLSTKLAADADFRRGKEDSIVSCPSDQLATVIAQMGFAPRKEADPPCAV